MSSDKQVVKKKYAPYRVIVQRRVSAIDHRRPQRWNWEALIRPLDASLQHHTPVALSREAVKGLRYFWLDGLFAAISENFYLSFIPLFALAYGASNGQIGTLTAAANLLGALSLFPGARLVEAVGKRKSIVLWTGGGFARLALLCLALAPFVVLDPGLAILTVVVFNALRAFMANLGNPAWTAMVADLVPHAMRGRYFGSRNTAMGLAALLIAPLAGRLINAVNDWQGSAVAGFQLVFFLAFLTGMVSTFSYRRIPEPQAAPSTTHAHQPGDFRRAIRSTPGFIGLVVSAFVWNLALQVAAPFFNVYLVNHFNASTTLVGLVASASSLTALIGQPVFGRLLDRKGAIWIVRTAGFGIPFLPIAWMFITAPWQVGIINLFGGFMWAGYNLANFNLLLEMTPEAQRPRAVALYQTMVFSSAVIGPLLGGFLADAVSYKLIFGLSGAGRMLGLILFLWLAARPALRHMQTAAAT